MDKVLLQKLKNKKKALLNEGFEIIGVFGSYAKGIERKDSDIDLLYDIKPAFLEKHRGFEAFAKINEIREELKEYLQKNVDLATIDNHSKTFKEYALKDVIYV